MCNLNGEYIEFVESGGNLTQVAQDVIDRIQYCDGFMDELQALLKKYEAPFEVHGEGVVRILKPNFQKI